MAMAEAVWLQQEDADWMDGVLKASDEVKVGMIQHR